MDTQTVSIKDVISHYNLVGLGIGVAIGVSGKDLAFSLANDVIMPLVGKVIKTSFTDQYKFDPEKFISTLLTFIIVFAIILLLLYVVLRPMVKSEIQSTKAYNNNITGSLGSIVTYQEEIKKDLDKIAGHVDSNLVPII